MTGSIEGGEVQRCGLVGGLSSLAFWVERRRVLWRGSNEQAKGRAEWDVGVYVVLVRALGEGARRAAWHGREGHSAKQEAVE